jgi:hypothetical protein
MQHNKFTCDERRNTVERERYPAHTEADGDSLYKDPVLCHGSAVRSTVTLNRDSN